MLVITAVLQIVQISRPSFRTIHDDGIYVTTAKAMAEGRGYIIDSLPKPLAQTKYPIVFPAMLSAVWKLYPEFPANLPWLRFIPLACFWAWLYLVWRLFGELLGMRERTKWIIALLVSAPLLAQFVRTPLSEMPFALFSTWVVLLLTKVYLEETPPRTSQALLLGVAFALAFHTRTAAVALLPVVVLTLLRKRAWSAMALFGAVAICACGPWLYWQSIHPPPSEEPLRFYSQANYADWNLLGSTQVTDPTGVVIWNVMFGVGWPQYVWIVPSSEWLMPAYLVMAAVTMIGVWILLRGPGFGVALWTASSMVLSVLWVWPPWRFQVPLLPFLLLALTASIPATAPSAIRVSARAVATVLIISGMWLSGQPEKKDAIWPEYARLFDWLRTNTRDTAIVAGSMDPSYWLYANRRSIRAYEYDPLRLYYRAWEVPSEGEDARRLDRLLRDHRVDYLVFEAIPNMAETHVYRRRVQALQARSKELLEQVFATPSGRILVFRVRREFGLDPVKVPSGIPLHEGSPRPSPSGGAGQRPSM